MRHILGMMPKFLFALTLFASGGSASAASVACGSANLAVERGNFQRLLRSNIGAKGEGAFLLQGAEHRLKAMRSSDLNRRGSQCGIDTVRAHVYSCVNSTVTPAMSAIATKQESTKALWGRPHLSARGALVIGMFEACRAAAKETFMSK